MVETKAKSTIDFSQSSQKELIAALRRIHKDKFPANYQACADEIQKRKESGAWSEEVEKLEQLPTRALFSLKRRFLSYIIDGAVVAVFSLLFTPLSQSMNGLGRFGVVPFWIVNFLYCTLMNGPTGKGQTIGKRITNLKIVNSSGNIISWKQACLRGAYLFLFVGSWYGLYDYTPGVISQGFYYFLFFFYLADFLCMFKHPQQRSLVDLLTDTLILDSEGLFPEKLESFSALLKYKKWFTGVAVVAFGLVISFLMLTMQANVTKYDGVKLEIESNTSAHYLGGGFYSSYVNGQQTAHGINLSFWVSPDVLSDMTLLKSETAKIRKILNNSNIVSEGQNNILITGIIFKGLLPIHYVYKNPDFYPVTAK